MAKILVIRFSAIGDVAMTIPVIYSLATQYPQHQIMVLSRDTLAPLFEGLPDNVLFRGVDLRGEHSGLMGLGWLYNDLKEEQFDAVADFHDVLRSKYLRWRFKLSGVKVAHLDKGRSGKRKLVRPKHKVMQCQKSSFQRYADVLRDIGYPIQLDFVSLFGDKKGTIQCMSPLTGDKDKNKWIGIAPFRTCRKNLPPVQTRAGNKTTFHTERHQNIPVWWRTERDRGIGKMGEAVPQCHFHSRKTDAELGTGINEPFRRNAIHGLRQYAPGLFGKHPRYFHLGGYPSIRRVHGLEAAARQCRPGRSALPSLFRIREQALS